MTRMTRELSLVLLGAGVLTAGYFIAPAVWEEDPAHKADEQTLAEVGGEGQQQHTSSGYHRARSGLPLFIYLPIAGGRYGGQSAAAVPRGGFGAVGGGYTAAS